MAIATTFSDYLNSTGVAYTVMRHSHTYSSLETAEAAHVPGDQVAKPVVLHDNNGYVMAVIPSTHRARIGVISKLLDRNLEMATEEEIGKLFNDCEIGAVPAIGKPYGVDMIWDDDLAALPDVYMESGDHEILVHVAGEDFKHLVDDQKHGHISTHM
jgi:Ala-tRNA(Pro) deacylase